MASQHFVLNRADKIGDVVLALPMAGILKATFPGCKVSLLGQRYTLPIARCCEHLDAAYAWDEIAALRRRERIKRFEEFGADVIFHIYPKAPIARLARQARIPLRIGTSRRMYHWTTCNRLVYVRRHHSPLHEAQLDIELLRGVGIERSYTLDEISSYFGLSNIPALPAHLARYIARGKFNLIMHPKSAGSAREWPLQHFARLIKDLPPERFNVLITGSENEGKVVRPHLPLDFAHANDLTGKLSLEELMALINTADGLLAASTGPLHIAAVLGKPAFGVFVPFRSKHTGRWGPIGPRARAFQLPEICAGCPNPSDCECMRRITPTEIKVALMELAGDHRGAAPVITVVASGQGALVCETRSRTAKRRLTPADHRE